MNNNRKRPNQGKLNSQAAKKKHLRLHLVVQLPLLKVQVAFSLRQKAPQRDKRHLLLRKKKDSEVKGQVEE